MRRLTGEEAKEIAGEVRGWMDTRNTYAVDSKILPGYALSEGTLGIAMARMAPALAELFVDTFLAAICDVCANPAATQRSEGSLLLQSYINQWADGNAAIARAQPSWEMVETIAVIVDAAAGVSTRSMGVRPSSG
jgi:hypothetical protein